MKKPAAEMISGGLFCGCGSIAAKGKPRPTQSHNQIFPTPSSDLTTCVDDRRIGTIAELFRRSNEKTNSFD
jgi:hypothetical protein